MLWVETNTLASRINAQKASILVYPMRCLGIRPFRLCRLTQYVCLFKCTSGFMAWTMARLGSFLRQAQECLQSGSERAKRAFDQLQHYGFIVCHANSSFTMKTKRAREWEITFQPMPDGHKSHKWRKINDGSISATDGSQTGAVSELRCVSVGETVPCQPL